MDKVTRMVHLYSKLVRGENVNKLTFCTETDAESRSFDRDIADMRNCLLELCDGRELLYDKSKNNYYLTGDYRVELETMEYNLIERILLDTRSLRNDEMEVLLRHLFSNTRKTSYLINSKDKMLTAYKEPMHSKPILKIYGDLDVVVRKKLVIKIKYEEDGAYVEKNVVPCTLKYDKGYLYLIAYMKNKANEYPNFYRLDKIYSFEVIWEQNEMEKKKVQEYLQSYAKGITQMYGGEYIEIEIVCDNEFYSYLYDNFHKIEIVKKEGTKTYAKLHAFENGFVRWIVSQPIDKIKVTGPDIIRKKICREVKRVAELYDEGN